MIRKIFMFNSLYLLARGLLWGNLLAFVLLFVQYQFEIISLDETTYYMSSIPVSFNIDSIIQKGNPGVWVKKNNAFFKIASIGVRISHWVTWHGISINVNPNLKPFEEIVPCGVQNGFVTSIKKEGKNVSLDQFDKKLKENFYLFF